MSKVTYTKIKSGTDTNEQKIKTFNWNNNVIEVKQYLPIEDKIELINNVLKISVDENGYINPIKEDILFYLYVIFTYTNISFTDKQKENLFKIYDYFKCSRLLELILDKIPSAEFNELFEQMELTAKFFEKTLTSIPNIIKTINSNTEKTMPQIQEFLKQIQKEKE